MQGGHLTFAQGGDGCNILACRGVIFMPGKSRRVYYNSETAKSQVFPINIFPRQKAARFITKSAAFVVQSTVKLTLYAFGYGW